MVIKSLKDKYKQTDIGLIPKDWNVKTVSQFGDVKRGASSQLIKYVNHGIRLIRINDFLGENPAVVKQTDEIMKFAVDEHDVLFAGTGASAGASFIPKKEWIGCPHSYNAPRIRVKKEYSKEYLLCSLQSDYVRKQMKSLLVGAAQPFLDINAISNFKIVTPSTITEQSRIAQTLFDINEFIDTLEQLILKKKNLMQGVIQQLLTGKIRLDGFDGKWELKKLCNISKITMGQSPESKFYNNSNDGLPLIQGNADIKKRETIIRFFTSKITKTAYKEDIIMSVRAPVGEIAKATFDCCLGRGVCAISYKNNYLYYYLIFIEKCWGPISTGSTFDSINSKEVSDLEIFIPSSEKEQIAISKILLEMDLEIKRLKQNRDKHVLLKDGMSQKLLTGEIRLK